MKQPVSTMDMIVRIKNPYILIKDRPYFDTDLEVDLGEITINVTERDVYGRFKLVPEKAVK